LKPCHASTIPRLVSKPPSPIVVNGEQKYKVEEIFDSKLFNQYCNISSIGKVMALANALGN
jgi:hypothetical protein